MSDTDQSGTSQSSEEEHERLNRQFMELLYEARTAILGVQVLFVFLLRVPFSPQFSSLSTPEVYVWYAILVCTLLSAVLLMAPSPHHRILWREHQREERIELGNRLILTGLSFLALAILGVVFLISELLFGGVAAAVATVGVGMMILWVWYGQPLLSMRG
jgi:magnesium-transporting ATPase (P-type)